MMGATSFGTLFAVLFKRDPGALLIRSYPSSKDVNDVGKIRKPARVSYELERAPRLTSIGISIAEIHISE